MVTWLQCLIKALNVAYGKLIQWPVGTDNIRNWSFQVQLLNIYIAKIMLCILLKFVQLMLNR